LTPLSTADVVWIAGAVLVALMAGIAVQYAHRKSSAAFSAERLPFERSVGWHLVPLAGVLLLAQPPVYGLLGSQAAKVIAGLQVEKLSRGEALAMIDGYYEELNDNSLQSGPFLRDPAPARSKRAVDFGDLVQRRDDLLGVELIPNWKGSWADAPITINRWGMRDRDRTIVKPANTVRIALVGSSLVMGFGVGDDETFARLLEDRLNAQAAATDRRIEVLNFGCGQHYPIHRRLQIEHKILPFEPDLIVYFAHQDELYSSARHLASAVYRGIDLEDSCLDDLVRRAGITVGASEALVHAAMEQHHAEILRCLYRRMVERCRAAHTELLYVYLPIPGDHDLPFDPRVCLTFAKEAGLSTVELADWWGRRAPEEVLLGPLDHHPNPLGHRLLADALEEVLRARTERGVHAGE
jgi:hypothetical protein